MIAKEILKFYYVESDYLDFLRDSILGDVHIPFIDYKNKKFFIGVVLQIGNHKYFAPVSSYKEINSATFNIVRRKKIMSSIRLNYMFPVVDGVYKKVDFNTIQDKAYKNIVETEYRICNDNLDTIKNIANKIYTMRKNGKIRIDGVYINDFSKLERRASEYSKLKN